MNGKGKYTRNAIKRKGGKKRKAFIGSITKKGSKFACNDETTSENLEIFNNRADYGKRSERLIHMTNMYQPLFL